MMDTPTENGGGGTEVEATKSTTTTTSSLVVPSPKQARGRSSTTAEKSRTRKEKKEKKEKKQLNHDPSAVKKSGTGVDTASGEIAAVMNQANGEEEGREGEGSGERLRKVRSATALGSSDERQSNRDKKEKKEKKQSNKKEKKDKREKKDGGPKLLVTAADGLEHADAPAAAKDEKEVPKEKEDSKDMKPKSPRARGRTAASLLFTYPRRDREEKDKDKKEKDKDEKDKGEDGHGHKKSSSDGGKDSFSLRLPISSKQRRKTSVDADRVEVAAGTPPSSPMYASSHTTSARTKSMLDTKQRSKDDSLVSLHSHNRSDLSASPKSSPLTSRTAVNDDAAGDEAESSSSDTEDTFDDDRGKDIADMNIHLPPSLTDLNRAERATVKVVHLLYNPRSGNKTGEKVMRNARKLLERNGKTVNVTKLQYKGHAEVLCETMDLEGIDVLCSVGGDGTFHECINGMMKRLVAHPDARVPPMALIAAGTGNSFMHELGAAKMKTAVKHICRGVHVPIDICKLSFGDSTSCYSFNSMHWGMASKVAVTAEKLRWMGTAIRYTTAALIEMMKGKTARARITITDENDNVVTYDEEFALAIANNIITAGKGMKMAPEARLDDGLIDLLLITTASTLDMMTIFRKVYDGSHTRLPHVRYIKVKSFSIVPYRARDEKKEREKSKVSGKSWEREKEREKEKEKEKDDKKEEKEATTATATDEDPKGEKELEASTESSSPISLSSSDLSAETNSIEEIEELLDVDGELKGCTPFTCDVIPRAIRVIL